MSVQHRFPHVAGTYTPTDSEKKKVPKRGYSQDRGEQKYKTTLTREQVIEARWMNEFGGWTTKQVRQHYGLDDAYAYNLLSYVIRGKIQPKADDFPKGHQPKPTT